MPLYSFKCQLCGREFDVFYPKYSDGKGQECLVCQGPAEKTVQKFNPKVFKPLTLEHINVEGEGPMTFNSEAELRAHCKKHGLSSGALL